MKLAAELAGTDASSLKNLVRRADGNPLFLEQLIGGLSKDSDEQLPDTIQGLVLARVDRPPAHDREALFIASVLGQRFTLDLLRQVLADQSYNCSALTQLRLLRTEGDDHVFCHALVRDGLYASLIAERRGSLHLRAAAVYAARDPILHAQHLDLAGSPKAPAAYLAAAQSESERIRYESALQLVQRGITLGSSDQAYEMRMLEGELHRRLGNISEAINAYKFACSSTIDAAEKCRALIGVAEGLRVSEAYVDLLETLETALCEIADLDLPKQRARICQLRASVHFVHGEIQQCLDESGSSLEYARAAGSHELEAQALGNLADAEFARGRMVSAHRLFDNCVNLATEHGIYNVTAANLSMRGQALLYLGHPGDAFSDCEQALDLAARQFNPRAELVARLVGFYTLELFDTRTGRSWAEAGLDLAKRLGAERFELVCIEYLGRLAAIDGDIKGAEQLVSEALERYRLSESSMRFLGGRALGSYALVCTSPEKRRAALREGEDLLKLGAAAHNTLWFYRDAIEVSLERNDWDEVDRYALCLEDYTRTEPLAWSTYFAGRGRALSKKGRGEHASHLLTAMRAEGERIGFMHSLARIDVALG